MKTRLGMLPPACGAVIVAAPRMAPAESQPGWAPFDRFRPRVASGPFMPECVKAGLERA
jgi:hypothetical protein